MCTLAWGNCKGRLWVCFNRDKERSRPDAVLPEIIGDPGKRLVYALDPVGGGSWFVASECGHAVALLNHYPGEKILPDSSYRSRGLLVLELARAESVIEAEQVLREMDLCRFAPFHVFLLSPESTRAFTWDAEDLVEHPCPQKFWTTSSYCQDKVVPWRVGWWKEQICGRELDRKTAGKILRTPNPGDPAIGTTMDREDARTVSQIQLQMDESGFRFEYRKREEHESGYLPPENLICER